MSNQNSIPKPISDRALEMIMRDVLDGVMELSLESAFRESFCDFEIIEISPANKKQLRKNSHYSSDLHQDAEILSFPNLKRAAG